MSDTPRTDAACNIYDLQIVAEDIERELNAANDRIKRIEDAGDYLCAAAAFMGWHDKIDAWNKAKEVK